MACVGKRGWDPVERLWLVRFTNSSLIAAGGGRGTESGRWVKVAGIKSIKIGKYPTPWERM